MGLSHPKAEPLQSEGAACGYNHELEGAKTGPGCAMMTLGRNQGTDAITGQPLLDGF